MEASLVAWPSTLIFEGPELKWCQYSVIYFYLFAHTSCKDLNEFKEETLTISRSAGPAGLAIKFPVFESYLFPLLKVL